MFIIRFFGIFFCVILLVFAFDSIEKHDEFGECEKAYNEGAWLSAEHLLTKYLRNEVNPDKSWQAWLLLLNLGRKTNLHQETLLAYLYDMLEDYKDDIPKRKFILAEIAKTFENLEQYEQAIRAWEKYAALDNLTPEELFVAYQRLIRHYFLLDKFEEVEIVLTDCVVLSLPPKESAYCIYNLADLKAGLGQLDEASELIETMLVLDMDDYDKAQANFLYGDVLEQRRKFKQALEQFKLAGANYGNQEVVNIRIAALEKKLKIKPSKK